MVEERCLVPGCAMAARAAHPRTHNATNCVSLYLPQGPRMDVITQLLDLPAPAGPAVETNR
eukprot:1816816-Lingulodinium_polyedra.AAC.1